MNEEINKEAQLDQLASDHNNACLEIAKVRTEYDQAVAALRDVYVGHLNAAVDAAGETEALLYNAIVASPELFAGEPRTRQVGTVSFGMRRLPGKITIANQNKSVESLRKQAAEGKVSPELVEAAIETKYVVKKSTVGDLPAAALKRAGIKVIAAADEVVLKDEVSGEGRALVKSLRSGSVAKPE